MNSRSTESQLLMVLLAILMLTTLLALHMQQIPPVSRDISDEQSQGHVQQNRFISSYTTRDPITITSNADFVSEGFPGSGTAQNPYIIEGYSISTSGVSIYFENTDAYFVIRDCLLIGGISIEFNAVFHGEIRNNIIDGTDRGLWFSATSDQTIADNEISGNDYGIDLWSSTYTTIVNNTISGFPTYGMSLASSSYNTVINNTISYTDFYGVFISSSSHNEVVDNTISGNDYGMYFYSSSDNTIIGNTITRNLNGVYIYSTSDDNVVTDNVISGNDIGMYISSSSSNTVVDNLISENDYGVHIYGSSYNTVVDNTISGNRYGVRFYNSSNNTAVRNTISGNSNHGVYIRQSSDNTVVNNNISRNNYGVYLYFSSSHNLIFLNVFADNTVWNAYDIGSGNQWNSTVTGNYWSDYNGTGVHHIPGDAGSTDYYPTIYATPPTINQPTDMVFEEGTVGSTITWIPSDTNPSHYVVYRNNTEVVSDNWDGNSITVNVDGLSGGVYNYTIVVYEDYGNSVNDTVFVAVSAATAPTIDHPLDVEYIEGTTGYIITWMPSEAYPSHFVVFRNGTGVVSAIWDGNTIIVNVDGLSVGVYNYTIAVYDATGNCASDTVIVTIQPEKTTTTTTTTTTSTTTTATSSTTTSTTTTNGDVTGSVIVFLFVIGIEVAAAVLILVKFRRGS